MLQTTENQLKLNQTVPNHRQIIIDKLTSAGYHITNNRTYGNERPFLINYNISPIKVQLDIDIRLTDMNSEYIIMVFQKESTKLSDICITCTQFTTSDIQALADLYIHMLQNNITAPPKTLKFPTNNTLKQGQLAEIISEYLNKEKLNVANNNESTNA